MRYRKHKIGTKTKISIIYFFVHLADLDLRLKSYVSTRYIPFFKLTLLIVWKRWQQPKSSKKAKYFWVSFSLFQLSIMDQWPLKPSRQSFQNLFQFFPPTVCTKKGFLSITFIDPGIDPIKILQRKINATLFLSILIG